jgi:hypothetical protein
MKVLLLLKMTINSLDILRLSELFYLATNKSSENRTYTQETMNLTCGRIILWTSSAINSDQLTFNIFLPTILLFPCMLIKYTKYTNAHE